MEHLRYDENVVDLDTPIELSEEDDALRIVWDHSWSSEIPAKLQTRRVFSGTLLAKDKLVHVFIRVRFWSKKYITIWGFKWKWITTFSTSKKDGTLWQWSFLSTLFTQLCWICPVSDIELRYSGLVRLAWLYRWQVYFAFYECSHR